MMTSDFEMRGLDSDDAIRAAYPVMAELRPHLAQADFLATVRAQERDGYRLLGGYASGRLVSLAGYRIARTLARGEHLFVDDLVTAKAAQRHGYGKAMLVRLARIAAEHGLSRLWLDSRDTALTFYERVGFSVHTSKPCWIDAETLGGKG